MLHKNLEHRSTIGAKKKIKRRNATISRKLCFKADSRAKHLPSDKICSLFQNVKEQEKNLRTTNLHHEDHSVESDHDHDGVLERWRNNKLPHPVLERLLVLGHVACQRFGIDGKVDTRSLRKGAISEYHPSVYT